jgi:preprotein translocase subunit YajC
MLEEKWEYRETIQELFVDFMKGYYSVRRDVLCDILIQFGILMKLVRLIKMCMKENYSRVCVGKRLSHMFPIKSGLKQGVALSPLFLNFALGCTISRVQVNQDGLKLNCTHQLLVYAEEVHTLSGRIHTIKKITEALVVVSKENGLEVNADKTKYMVMSRDQNAGQSHSMKIDNSSFERVEEFPNRSAS